MTNKTDDLLVSMRALATQDLEEIFDGEYLQCRDYLIESSRRLWPRYEDIPDWRAEVRAWRAEEKPKPMVTATLLMRTYSGASSEEYTCYGLSASEPMGWEQRNVAMQLTFFKQRANEGNSISRFIGNGDFIDYNGHRYMYVDGLWRRQMWVGV